MILKGQFMQIPIKKNIKNAMFTTGGLSGVEADISEVNIAQPNMTAWLNSVYGEL